MRTHSTLSLLFAASLWVATQAYAAPPVQQPVAAEKSPPGDIPDNQAFVTFRSALGFSVKVPEGWARRESAGAVNFSDKYNALQLAVAPQPAAPTLASLKAGEIAALEQSPKAVRVASVKALALPAGPAFVVHYGINSDPNAVTNKAIRLDSATYYLWKAGKLAMLTVSAPAGADNADQWLLMARSFTWH